MVIKSFVFNPFYENTYVVSSEQKSCFIIDPGCYEEDEVAELKEYIEMSDLQVKAILNTHCHIDHVLGNQIMKSIFNVPLLIPENEQETFRAMPLYAPQWGMSGYQHAEADDLIQENQVMELDELRFEVIEVPGHSPGHQLFYEKTEAKLIGGDVLFRESIGRTDLPGGDHNQLLTNIQQKVYILPDEVEVFPGHGPSTTVGHEKIYNPFVKG